MKSFINSDLAVEKKGVLLSGARDSDEYFEEDRNGFTVCTLKITSDRAEKKYGRKMGSYVTVFFDKIWLMDDRELEDLTRVISDEMEKMVFGLTGKKKNELSVLVVGLGNPDITADAIGPLAVKELTVTRHLKSFYKKILGNNSFASVCALTPGVLAQTGIESSLAVKEISDSISPDVIIAIDALASKSCERLGSTVQISDTGISPGAGIGNMQKNINAQSIGVPVIALGVPTVVDSATLICDALERAEITIDSKKLRGVIDLERGFFVSPKECDIIVKLSAKILAHSLNMAFGIES